MNSPHSRYAHGAEAPSSTKPSLIWRRIQADYDPVATFYKSDVQRLIVDTRAVLEEFERADHRERRSFAILVLFRARN